MPRLLIIYLIVLVSSAGFVRGNELKTCERDYVKIGCYEEFGTQAKDLLINDRHKIRWDAIESYMHNLACLCSEAARAANKVRSEPYVGFALHYYGECYGRTQTQMEALIKKDQTHRCVGNQTYTNCDATHAECVGQEYAEYIYKFREATIQNVNGGYGSWGPWTSCKGDCGVGVKVRERICTHPEPMGSGKDCSKLGPSTETAQCDTGKKCPELISPVKEARVCEGEGVSIDCTGDAAIQISSAMFGRLSLAHCEQWYGTHWRTDCRSPVSLTKMKKLCDGKSSCFVYANTGVFGDPCKGTEKYLEVTYRCKSRKPLMAYKKK
ncbi:rhamnose-binding lectin-like isoform X2 [Rhopilema esculentum]|eukprot:gene8625-14637_t